MRKYTKILVESEISSTFCDRCEKELKGNEWQIAMSLQSVRKDSKTGKLLPRHFELCSQCYLDAAKAFCAVVDTKL